jgi:hypothetical protein
VSANLILVLLPGVEDNVGDEDHEDILEQFQSEGELGEIVSLFQDLQNITFANNMMSYGHVTETSFETHH